ncbi:hypothetical protein C5167_001151 [Papaver somniferum]|uniref:RRM domain-containing protein n=1 Tax=Papaver somniferum TaxID=3469 RepID=A0A4Y7KRV3_PAPSO|nr:cleavage stimulating factor 64-like [Papaver somniferum]RZC76073.1 hypothetical protein C5167_001151 [Papaver somniferum]
MASSNSKQRCVFVGNIPYDTTEEQLVQICQEVGPVVSFRLVTDRETGRPKGFGFCEYKDEETALSARRNLQGYEINGRQLRVDFAESDKSAADRNRSTPSVVDSKKSIGGPGVVEDSGLDRPIGISLASTAASVMAGALGSFQNGAMSQSGSGSDQLTNYLANMSRNKMFDIMSEFKVMATQNKELARQLLLSNPQLPKALFQAQIMFGMVTPQVLQMPNIRQSPGSILQPPPLQAGHLPSVPQNVLVNNQPSSGTFPQLSMQPRFSHPQQPQPNQHLPQTGMSMQPGASTVPSMRPFSGFPTRPPSQVLEISPALNQQYQQPPLHLPRPPFPQQNFQPSSSNSIMRPSVHESVNKFAERSTQVTDDARNSTYPSTSSVLLEQKRRMGDASDSINRPSKLARLDDGMQYPEKQAPQQAPDNESALLEQVMNLTPEQLSSLTLEQRQQVIELQKMLGNR